MANEATRLAISEMNDTQSESLNRRRIPESSLVKTSITTASTSPVTAESKINSIGNGNAGESYNTEPCIQRPAVSEYERRAFLTVMRHLEDCPCFLLDWEKTYPRWNWALILYLWTRFDRPSLEAWQARIRELQAEDKIGGLVWADFVRPSNQAALA